MNIENICSWMHFCVKFTYKYTWMNTIPDINSIQYEAADTYADWNIMNILCESKRKLTKTDNQNDG